MLGSGWRGWRDDILGEDIIDFYGVFRYTIAFR